ncbi:hypothetical protein Tco_1024111 [Tanacetum coccineum]
MVVVYQAKSNHARSSGFGSKGVLTGIVLGSSGGVGLVGMVFVGPVGMVFVGATWEWLWVLGRLGWYLSEQRGNGYGDLITRKNMTQHFTSWMSKTLVPRCEKSMRNGGGLRDRVKISSAITTEQHPTS